ncbi:MAG TPA: trypsin-like peptidase domain-containing protein [Chloroflexia bacterium]|nr:trypsin-like peptidase domain-containing protein [Chloroflexia bacterium]
MSGYNEVPQISPDSPADEERHSGNVATYPEAAPWTETGPKSANPSASPPPLNQVNPPYNPYTYGASGGGNQFYPPYIPVRPSPPPEKPRERSWGWLWLGIVLILAVLIGAALIFLLSRESSTSSTDISTTAAPASVTVAPTVAPSITQATPAATGQLTVEQVAEIVRPAVVQINSLQNATFGGSSQETTGVGSGVIYDKNGYILTNAHVVEGAKSLIISLPDGRYFNGTIVGIDNPTDLAVVKIDPAGADLPLAEFGDSASLRVGEEVVAIGNALALPGGPTVTAGVVSALDRSVTEPGAQNRTSYTQGAQLFGMIQTDAAVNSGNSGGPLADSQGKVIGINTLTSTQGESISFAISINQAKEVAAQLVQNGKVSHAYTGFNYTPLTPAISSQLKLDSSIRNGAVLTSVQSGSPAAKASLKQADVLVMVDGQQLTGESTLGIIVNNHQPGDVLTLQVITPVSYGGSGQARTVQITLGEASS